MTASRKVVKVFLASPGDLLDERKATKIVIDDFNATYAEVFGYQVELVGWEDTVSVYGRPQATINRELERCELFIGLMWKKWGTPPDTKGKYSSGFEEEFELSVQRKIKEDRPEISLLFKEIAPEFRIDPGNDLKKVLAFKEKLISEKEIYFESFSDVRELERKIHRCVSNYVIGLYKKEVSNTTDQNQAPKADSELQQTQENNNTSTKTLFSINEAKYLRGFISKAEHETSKNPISAAEIARFRLLANRANSLGNDAVNLGIHDANLVFTECMDLTLEDGELNGLLSSGFEHYTHENVPLWRWLAKLGGFTKPMLPLASVFELTTEGKLGALAAMLLISEPLPVTKPLDRNFYLKIWFEKDVVGAIKVAALNYLGECGITADLPAIIKELDKREYQTTSAAVDAIIRINLRDSREKAVIALYDLQPTSISKKVLGELFNNDIGISTETLLNGVNHRNSEVRRIVVELLCIRKALPNDIAKQLLADSDAKIRYEALKSLLSNGHTFSDDDAKTVLVRQTQNKGLGLLGAIPSDTAGESYWSNFQLQRLRSLTDKELESSSIIDLVLNPDSQFILAERQFKRYSEKLRRYVDDQYKEMFSKALQAMEEQFGARTELLEKIRSLEDHLRKELTRKGLDVLCRKADSCDLGRVRQTLKSGFINYSYFDIDYLRKFGEWEDIPLIIEAVSRAPSGYNKSLLSTGDESKYISAARAIYTLGQTRLPEILSIPAPSKLLSQLIVEVSDKAFRELSDLSINLLFQSEDDLIRKYAAIKCVKSLPKVRIKNLLSEYISNEKTRFYNVVHWLDFGVSTPRDRVLKAAEKILRNKQQV